MAKKRNHNGLTPREQEFCDLYSRYAGNLTKVGKAMRLSPHVLSVSYVDNIHVKEYLSSTLQRSREAIVQAVPNIIDNLMEMANADTTPPSTKVQIAAILMDRAGLTPPKSNISVSVNTLISDRARELLAARQETPIPPIVQNINIIEEKQEEFT